MQTLNIPASAGFSRAGSAGRTLPHARLRVAENGEIMLGGALFGGYLGDPSPVPDWWPTGDLGRIDEEGFVHVTGRKKHVLITAFGRNISPEWVETALRSQPAVMHAVVFGDGQPALSAVLWPIQAETTDHAWLLTALDEYIEEEAGHDEWILDDIAACGGDAKAVRQGASGHATEVMVAYAYDMIARVNPLGFFGMVHVLEGTSVSLALLAADAIQMPLGLPERAFSYLRSHGTLDQVHTAHFAMLMDRIEDPEDQAAIVHAAKAFFRLYGAVFQGLPLPQATAQPAEAVA